MGNVMTRDITSARYSRAALLLSVVARPGVLRVLDTLARRSTRFDALDGREWGRCLDAGLATGSVPCRLTPLGAEVWSSVSGLVYPAATKPAGLVSPSAVHAAPESPLVRKLQAVSPLFVVIVLLIAGSKLVFGGGTPVPAEVMTFAQAPIAEPAEPSMSDALVGYAALLAAVPPLLTALFAGLERVIRAWRSPGVPADGIDVDPVPLPVPPTPPIEPGG